MAARRRAHSSSHGGVAAVGLAAVCSFICRREVQGRAALGEAQRVGGRWGTRRGAQQRRAREDPAAFKLCTALAGAKLPIGLRFYSSPFGILDVLGNGSATLSSAVLSLARFFPLRSCRQAQLREPGASAHCGGCVLS
ncbi:hypothetical protein TraAM80_10522 [Trypanosoma rangeli]|uniref:Uncharacterized protein n=1 Tax=Trypanosoma rangeli TaxID=5698 RepID=A0A422MNV7_TRYRA|nr:uncharacterized protein TraAM80_10522 [Trypanosoma rangeli]RNE94887.1 hypothetical protein TraAM80_10522 [Trypanosoma rangeli]|eukprot:RNE94887.1 hypothetical protein TraAM80_10522 [Trypanosoma rangeli]